MKQSAGPHAAPLLTRIDFDGRSPQAGWQNIDAKRPNTRQTNSGMFFVAEKQNPAGRQLVAKGLWNRNTIDLYNYLHFSVSQNRILVRAN